MWLQDIDAGPITSLSLPPALGPWEPGACIEEIAQSFVLGTDHSKIISFPTKPTFETLAQKRWARAPMNQTMRGFLAHLEPSRSSSICQLSIRMSSMMCLSMYL